MTAVDALNEELKRLHETLRNNCELFARYKGVMIPIGTIREEIERVNHALIEIAKMEVVK